MLLYCFFDFFEGTWAATGGGQPDTHAETCGTRFGEPVSR